MVKENQLRPSHFYSIEVGQIEPLGEVPYVVYERSLLRPLRQIGERTSIARKSARLSRYILFAERSCGRPLWSR